MRPAARTVHVNQVERTVRSGDREFRKDVNGLRAWAVFLVVLYHFRVPGFQGGFVGVDVFFVISGFLMTKLITESLAKNPWQDAMLGFFLARARRILPALGVMLLVILCLGWVFLPPAEYRQLGIHAASSAAFVSNFKFWMESGYFDTDSFEKWFLHTWSLSVEWQFYMALPVAVAMVWRLSKSRAVLTCCMAAAAVASFALSVWWTPRDPSAAFFMLHTRAWEMLAGGLIFLMWPTGLSPRAPVAWIESAGILLILGSAVMINSAFPWPGWMAVFPVAGSALVILAARSDSPWTHGPGFQWMGSASYSIYLWHWPVVVLLGYMERESGPFSITAGIAASLLLGHLSWKLVETRSRRFLTGVNAWRAACASASAATVAIGVGAFVYLNNGVPGRLDPHIERVFNEVSNKNPRMDECHVESPKTVPGCVYGSGPLRAIVLGDSHAASVVRTVEASIPGGQGSVLDWTYSACPTLLKAVRNPPVQDGRQDSCRDFNSFALKRAQEIELAPLLIVNRMSNYLGRERQAGLESNSEAPAIAYAGLTEGSRSGILEWFERDYVETVCAFAAVRPTYLMRPLPEQRQHVPRVMGRALMFGRDVRLSISLDEYHERHRTVWRAQDAARDKCGVEILDPLPFLCSEGRCWGDLNGLPLYFDDDHLSERGARLLIPLFQQMLRDNDPGAQTTEPSSSRDIDGD